MADALRFLASEPDWYSLDKVHEIITADLGKRGNDELLVDRGWVTRGGIDAFRKPAQHQTISGDAARMHECQESRAAAS